MTKEIALSILEKCPPSRRGSIELRGYTLDDVYTSYSHNKAIAWAYVERLCGALDGTGLGVTSFNTFSFCARFFFTNPDNGRKMVALITPRHNWAWYTD